MSIHVSRRHFIATTAAWAAGRAVLGAAESPDHKTVSIIHTTDLHGHILPTKTYTGITDVGGFARCATQIRRWRKENLDSLLVDIGDLYQGTAASYHNEGRLFVDLLANFEYDAWTLGNHDFDWGPEVLANNIKAAKIPILTANLTGAPEKVIPWRMREIAGFRIALIGLVTPGLPFWLMPETLGGIAPTDPALALKKSIAQARSAKADAIVVLGHYGHLKEDDFANPIRNTLTEAPGADVFIAGHTHAHVPSLEIGGTLYTQANYYGINCGKVDLTFDVNSRKLIAKTAATAYMDNGRGTARPRSHNPQGTHPRKAPRKPSRQASLPEFFRSPAPQQDPGRCRLPRHLRHSRNPRRAGHRRRCMGDPALRKHAGHRHHHSGAVAGNRRRG